MQIKTWYSHFQFTIHRCIRVFCNSVHLSEIYTRNPADCQRFKNLPMAQFKHHLIKIFEYHVSQRRSGGTELTNKVPLKHSVDKNIKPLLWIFSDFIPESPLIVHKLQWEAVFLWHNSNAKSFNSYCLHFNKHSSWLLNLWVFFA